MNELGNFNDGSDEFTFHHENRLTLSRADISALAQAKAANYCGQNIVLETTNTTPDDYTRLYLAGGFANYINIQNAIDIGFIPNIPPNAHNHKIGNASLQGATIMLTNATKRATIETLVADITHIELETNPQLLRPFCRGLPIQTLIPPLTLFPLLQEGARGRTAARRNPPLRKAQGDASKRSDDRRGCPTEYHGSGFRPKAGGSRGVRKGQRGHTTNITFHHSKSLKIIVQDTPHHDPPNLPTLRPTSRNLPTTPRQAPRSIRLRCRRRRSPKTVVRQPHRPSRKTSKPYFNRTVDVIDETREQIYAARP